MSSSGSSKPPMVKIRFPLSQDDPSGAEAEWMWAEPVGHSGFAVRNVPTFIYGISFGDMVSVKSQEGFFEFDSILARGGHSTYRIYSKTDQDEDKLKVLLDQLLAKHCEFERANKRIVGVDVLPEADIYAVYQTLEDAENAGIIEFEEGHCGHPLKADS